MTGDKVLLDVKTENKVLLDVEYVKKKYVVTSIYDIWGREVLPLSDRPDRPDRFDCFGRPH